MSNALVIHGGAPTAVINASLYGIIEEAKKYPSIKKVFGALGGTGGILNKRFIELSAISQRLIDRLPFSPASAIGTSRDHLEPEDYDKIAEIIKLYDFRILFFTGGNGTMDACGKVFQACQKIGVDVQVIGVPKTIDNDLAVTDHAPGYGSSARYLAATVGEIAQDVRSLPIHVSIVESMGRNAGWLTAASALARDTGVGPDLIYLPEVPFDEDRFLTSVQEVYARKSCAIVCVSEGLKNAQGKPIVEPIFQTDRSVYFGDVSAHLAGLVIKRLGIKARSEKPGICGRASIMLQSTVDREEAIMAGRAAVAAAMIGETGIMIGFERDPNPTYQIKMTSIPISKVMLGENLFPSHYISASGTDVTNDFINWCRPLIGDQLPEFVSFRSKD